MASPKWIKRKRSETPVILENLNNYCVSCGASATSWSALEMAWCDDHSHRGKLADWAAINNFPYLDFFPYKIAADEATWRIAIGVGNDEAIWMALAAIEYLESQESAS